VDHSWCGQFRNSPLTVEGSGDVAHTDADIAEYLISPGIPLEAYYLIGEPGCDLPALWLPGIGLRIVIVENDALAAACLNYLARRGVRRFKSGTDMLETSQREQWPGCGLQ
jgi:hypothetical protein